MNAYEIGKDIRHMIEKDGNFIHPTAIIYAGVEIGRNNYIGAGCIIGAPPEHRANWNPLHTGRVTIGDNNVFTANVTIDGGMDGITRIGSNTFWMKAAHAGHDAIVENFVTVSCGAKIGGHAIIRAGANLGLNSCVHQRITVEEGCMIGMGTIVTKKTETKPNGKYVGAPARYIGENRK